MPKVEVCEDEAWPVYGILEGNNFWRGARVVEISEEELARYRDFLKLEAEWQDRLEKLYMQAGRK